METNINTCTTNEEEVIAPLTVTFPVKQKQKLKVKVPHVTIPIPAPMVVSLCDHQVIDESFPQSPLSPHAQEFVPEHLRGEDLDTSISISIEKALFNQVKFQVFYHFSNENLKMDNYLLSKMHEHPDYWVSIHNVANLTKIKTLTEDESLVLRAVKTCTDSLELNEDESAVRRINFIPPKPKQHKDLRRTVFLYGLPPNVTKQQVVEVCREYGGVRMVALDKPDFHDQKIKITKTETKNEGSSDLNLVVDTSLEEVKTPKPIPKPKPSLRHDDLRCPDREVAIVIMTRRFGPRIDPESVSCTESQLQSRVSRSPSVLLQHPLINSSGNPFDFSHLRSAFVVFDSQSQANKCVKARMRSDDGIRALHKYDFNKSRKKVSAAKARGLSPLVSPLLSKSINSMSVANTISGQNSFFTYHTVNSGNELPRATAYRPPHYVQSSRASVSTSVSHDKGQFHYGRRFPQSSRSNKRKQWGRARDKGRRTSAPREGGRFVHNSPHRDYLDYGYDNNHPRDSYSHARTNTNTNTNTHSRPRIYRSQTHNGIGSRFGFVEKERSQVVPVPVPGPVPVSRSTKSRYSYSQSQYHSQNEIKPRNPDGSRGFLWGRNEVNTPQWLQQNLQFAQTQYFLMQQPGYAAKLLNSGDKCEIKRM